MTDIEWFKIEKNKQQKTRWRTNPSKRKKRKKDHTPLPHLISPNFPLNSKFAFLLFWNLLTKASFIDFLPNKTYLLWTFWMNFYKFNWFLFVGYLKIWQEKKLHNMKQNLLSACFFFFFIEIVNMYKYKSIIKEGIKFDIYKHIQNKHNSKSFVLVWNELHNNIVNCLVFWSFKYVFFLLLFDELGWGVI